MSLITVLTPTIPGRADLLERATASVKAQTIVDRQIRHVTFTDSRGLGPAFARDSMLAEVTGKPTPDHDHHPRQD